MTRRGTAIRKPLYPDGMMVVVDTGEQKPLFYDKPHKGLPLLREVLPHGDYSLRGFENLLCVERKRALEVYSWIGKEREKTIVKLEAMRPLYWKALVIEAPEDIVYNANKREVPFSKEYEFISKVSPYQVRRSLASIQIKYNLHIYFAETRTKAEDWILDRFEFFYTKVRNGELKGLPANSPPVL